MVVVMLAASTFGACIAKNYSNISPSLLMVGVMYIIQLSGLFQWCVRQSAEVENMMISVERILAYTRLPSEPAFHGPLDLAAENRVNWPESGQIEMRGVVCKYRADLQPVICGIDVSVAAGERVGIVGRLLVTQLFSCCCYCYFCCCYCCCLLSIDSVFVVFVVIVVVVVNFVVVNFVVVYIPIVAVIIITIFIFIAYIVINMHIIMVIL